MDKNNEAWLKLLDKYDTIEKIKADGSFRIKAPQIKEFRELRLMAKFDHYNNRPECFKENGLGILPVSRDEYILGNFNPYCGLDNRYKRPIRITNGSVFQSLTPDDITGETAAINYAVLSGILQDFLSEGDIAFTVAGRMSSGVWNFTIPADGRPLKINVNNAQIEIDAGYESPISLILIEAKMGFHNDFLVRQLYYPYRKWEKKVSKRTASRCSLKQKTTPINGLMPRNK